MELNRDTTKVIEYFADKRKDLIPDIVYGYSIYNLDLEKIIARVYKVYKATEWVKLDADTGNITEYYREFYFETSNGIISIAYDSNTWEPLEYYKDSNRRGLPERIKFDFFSGAEMTCDIFGGKKDVQPFVSTDVYKKIKSLPFDILYYSNKPYGHVVGFTEYLV